MHRQKPLPGSLPAYEQAAGMNRRRLLLLGGLGVVALPVATSLGLPEEPAVDGVPSGTPGASGEGAVRAASALDVRALGAVGDGVADDTAAVQALVDAAAADGTVGVLPPGTYRCTRSLLLPAGARLRLEGGARLLKDWAAPPGLANAFVRNADFGVRADGVRISGPGTIGARDHGSTGVIIALYGDDIRLEDFTVDTYAGGQAIMFAGDRGRITGVSVLNSAPTFGTGGIRMIGGEDFIATGCHVESGDDCLQFVPIGDPSALLFDMDIRRSAYIGCTGVSTASRFMVALLEWTRGDGGLTASVSDCSFSQCHGRAANRAIVVKNTHSSGAIERVTFTDCSVDMAGSEDREAQEIRVQTDAGSAGSVRDIAFVRTDVTNPVNPPVRIGGPGITGIRFEGCTFAAPSGAGAAGVVADSVDGLTFRDCTFLGAADKRQLTVGPQASVTDLAVLDCRFTGTSDRAWAVNLVSVAGARVVGCTFRESPGSTAARAVRVAPGTTGAVLRDNDVTDISAPNKIVDAGVGSVVRDNRGFPTEVTGTATVAAGTTSVRVAHGLARLGRAPHVRQVTVQPTGPGVPGRFWVEGVDMTSFRIVLAEPPRGAGATFGWRVDASRA